MTCAHVGCSRSARVSGTTRDRYCDTHTVAILLAALRAKR